MRAIVADSAAILGRTEDADHFGQLADRTRAAFNEHYVSSDGTIASDAPTVYALAITFGLLDDDAAPLAGERLAKLVADGGYRIQTGFAGTPFVTDALTSTGHLDDAYQLLLQTENPSWLYSGDDGGHHGLGAVGLDAARRHHQSRPDDELQPLRAGRRSRLDAPGDRRHRAARARLFGGADRTTARWRHHVGTSLAGNPPRTDRRLLAGAASGGLRLEADIPDGVSAPIRLPDGTERQVGAGTHQMATTG